MENLCPDCGKKMFSNQAGGLTCSDEKCGRFIMIASAEEHCNLLNIISIQEKIIKNMEKIADQLQKVKPWKRNDG